MDSFICNSTRFTFGNHTIALPVIVTGLPEECEGLQRKTAFHVSLVCIGEISKKIGTQLDEAQVIADFCAFIQSHALELVPRKEYWWAEQDEDESLVQMCDVVSLELFFNILREKYDKCIENQPTHITLFTAKKDRGIFLTTQADFDELCAPVDPEFPECNIV